MTTAVSSPPIFQLNSVYLFQNVVDFLSVTEVTPLNTTCKSWADALPTSLKIRSLKVKNLKEKRVCSLFKRIEKCKNSSIETITFSQSDVPDTVTSYFKNLPSLKKLTFCFCREMPEGTLSSLSITELAVSFCSDTMLTHLSALGCLTSLKLNCLYYVKDATLVEMHKLPLRTLSIENSQIVGPGLMALENMPLEHLSLSNNQLLKTEYLKYLPRTLKTLLLNNLHMRDEDFVHLRPLSLRVLSLNNENIKGGGLEHISAMPLKKLSLMHNINLSAVNIKYLRELPLTLLKLKGCPDIGIAAVMLLKSLSLTTLSLGGYKITDRCLEQIAHFPLTKLDIKSEAISNVGLSKLSNLPLKILYLSSSQVSNKTFSYFSKMPLEILALEYCDDITGVFLKYLDTRNLTHLKFIDCCHITLESLIGLPKHTKVVIENIADFLEEAP